MLGALSTTGQVALFGVASRIVEGVKMLPQAALAGVLPVLSADAADGAASNVRRAFHRRLRVFVWVSAVGLLVLAYPLIRLTYGSRYIDAWTALAVLAIGLPATVVNSARKVYLYASGREADATWWSGVSLVIQSVAAAALVHAWGAVGAGLALAVGEGAVARALSRAGGR
jgi:O-antigen/teichoic acid export membrane protein